MKLMVNKVGKYWEQGGGRDSSLPVCVHNQLALLNVALTP